MLVKVRLNSVVKDFNVSKAMLVEDFRRLVQEAFDIEPGRQRLIYAGKQFADGNDLTDYQLVSGHTISLMERVILGSLDNTVETASTTEKQHFKGEIDPDSGVDSPPSSSANSESGQASTSTQSMDEIRKICPELAAEMEKEEQPAAEPCKVCKDNARRKCRECGCNICGGKDEPERQLFCEQCQYVTHMKCLDPPLEQIPDGDWYCPDCFNKDDIIKAGEKVGLTKKTGKMKSRIARESNKKIRDWGKGEACAARRKVCTKVPKHHFGPIPGIEVGMCWESRMQLSEEGIHRPPVGGIAGTADVGAPSLVLSGGYEDDVDNGIEFYYTGAGGRDLSNNKRTGAPCEDQKFEKVNKALAKCCAATLSKDGAKAKDWTAGKPIRVSRSYKLKKHSTFAPEEGYRYDGLYKVVKYWPHRSLNTGFMVYRYLMRRDDPAPAPWEDGAKTFRMIKKADDLQTGKKRKTSDDEGSKAKKAKVDSFVLDKKYKTLILMDKLNEKLWKECLDFESEAETKLEWVTNVEEHFGCVCCTELLCKPVTTPCKHNLCLNCYRRSFKADYRQCPYCRTPIDDGLAVNKECSEALKALFPGYDAERK